jgi:hypothetical protein
MLVVAVRRRTTVRWAGVLVAVGGLTGCGSGSSSPLSDPPPAHHAKPSQSSQSSPVPAVDLRGAEQIVDSPRAHLGAFSTIPDHPERRVATWYVCRDPRCSHRTSAAVVTTDGFRHRTVVRLPPSRNYFGYAFWPAGRHHFVVTVNAMHPRLVDLQGHVHDIAVSGSVGPLAAGEVAVGGKGIRRWLGIDPDTGVAHPLSVPTDTAELLTEPGGQLRVLSVHFAYSWSDDGGSSWHRMPLPEGDRHEMAGMVPTSDSRVHVLQVGGDGATYFPWDRVLSSTDGRSWTTYDGPSEPKAYGDPEAVLPDGRLVLDVHAWSDQRRNRPSPRPLGLYEGTDWHRLRPVPLTEPFAHEDSHTFDPGLLGVAVTTHRVTIYETTPDQRGVVSSTDGGATWRPVRAR